MDTFYECTLSMEAAYHARDTLDWQYVTDRALAQVHSKTLRGRVGARLRGTRPASPGRLSSPPYRAARRIESAIEGRIVGALEAGERLSRASAVTVVIDAEAKEAFDDALDDADLEFEYREKEVDFSVEDYINFAGERSLIHFFAPDADDDDDMPPSVSQ